ncbi:MAG: glycosyl transferase [Lachnospiraceae bacterium]|nr:glycosyl transferase [Lachnospiraceae bacterium]
MKILILSCSTGQGHNSAALAVYENLLSHQVDCEFMDALLFAGKKTSNAVCKTYVNVASKTPHLFGLAYRAGGIISNTHTKSPVYYANTRYARQMYDYITGNHFDVVLTSHLFPAQTLTYIGKKYKPDLLTMAIATDYTSIPFWEETRLDYYIIPHRDLIREFYRKGIPREKLLPFGIPVSASFTERRERQEARRILGLPQEGFEILIMSGSMGFGHMKPLIHSFLKKYGDHVTIVAMGGSNEQLKSSLRERFGSLSNVYVLDYTQQVSLYMDSADLLYTKPGGLTSTEALVKGIPTIHTAPIPGCETRNARFFASHGLSYNGKTLREQIYYGQLLYDNSHARAAMCTAQQQHALPDAAERIYQFLKNHSPN